LGDGQAVNEPMLSRRHLKVADRSVDENVNCAVCWLDGLLGPVSIVAPGAVLSMRQV
jgi:hypothetical protein